MSTCYDKTGLTPDEAINEVLKLRRINTDLLAALESVVKICSHNCPSAASPAIALAEAAIAKATKS